MWVWIAFFPGVVRLHFISVGLMHCSRDLQVRKSVNFSLKLGHMAPSIHLKIISLQYFQFSVINSIQTNLKLLNYIYIYIYNIVCEHTLDSTKTTTPPLIKYLILISHYPWECAPPHSSVHNHYYNLLHYRSRTCFVFLLPFFHGSQPSSRPTITLKRSQIIPSWATN